MYDVRCTMYDVYVYMYACTVEAPVSRHPREAEEVLVIGAGCLRE